MGVGMVARMKTQSLVPMASVTDVERSIAFYKHLGFEVSNTFVCEGGEFELIDSDGYIIMVTHTD
jgi:predicted lactoylglutathione lyase